VFIDTTAHKRITRPEDIARVAVFFACSLSDHVTGEILLATAGDMMGEESRHRR
jgi:enoyl-[acyl-carrier-protein] reductase (NADH)